MKSKLKCNDRPVCSSRARERTAWNDALLTIITPGLKKLFSPESSRQEPALCQTAERLAVEDSEPEEEPGTHMQLGKMHEPNDSDFLESISDAQDYVAARRARKGLGV